MKIPSYSPYQHRFVLASAPLSRALHQAVDSFAPALKRWLLSVIQDHALDVRVDVKRGRTKKSNQGLIALAGEIYCER